MIMDMIKGTKLVTRKVTMTVMIKVILLDIMKEGKPDIILE